MKRLFSFLLLFVLTAGLWRHACERGWAAAGRRAAHGWALLVTGLGHPGALLPTTMPGRSEIDHLRISSSPGKPKIAWSFNPDDDLTAIRRAGFTHVIVSYLQGMAIAAQRRKLDECRQAGLRLIYRLVDLVDDDRRARNDALVQQTVLALRDHPALAAWETFEETNLPSATQVAVYRKIKQWDPDHPVITVITNEYTTGWYHRTYSDDAQDIVLIDYYPYKRGYNGWIYIPASMAALRAEQHRPIPIIPVIQASSSGGVSSAEDTYWPPPGGLEKQTNLWWSLGADAGVAFWIWSGSKEYPFIGVADPQAPPYALPETKALLARIPDGELPFQTSGASRQPPGERLAAAGAWRLASGASHGEIPAVRIWEPRENYLKNSGFEQGLEGWVGYNERATPTDQSYAGHGAARLMNEGKPKAMGVGQQTDLVVRPNETVTLSCYYRVVQPTTGLQWMIGTTAYPKFGAAAFLEDKERLPVGDWRRASISVTNSTGAPQRITGVSVLSNAFTGEVLLDNFQLERAPRASPYGVERSSPSPRLLYRWPSLPRRNEERGMRNEGRPERGSHSSFLVPRSSSLTDWTLAAWSAPEVPPPGDSYACLAAIASAGVGSRRSPIGPALEVRLRVDSRRSDPYGWVGGLEVARGETSYLHLPLRLAPGQPLFWALAGSRAGSLSLWAAPAGYRLASTAVRAGAPIPPAKAVSLGCGIDGRHPLNGLAGGGRLLSEALSPAQVDQLRGETP